MGHIPFEDNGEIMSSNEAKPNWILIFDNVACDGQ